ncbi:MAG: transglutaminase protein [Bacteroidetes bacterium]|nr:transglutaminase protein [Bacteroidota bacterium]
MRRLAPLLIALLCAAHAHTATPDILSEAAKLEESGRFRAAETLLTDALATAAAGDRATLGFELDRLRRIRLDYGLTRERLWRQLTRSVPDITEAEFARWISEGKFDVRVIDDTLRFLGVSRSNLFWRNPDIAARRRPAESDSAVEHAVLGNADAIVHAARLSGTPYVLPVRFAVTMKVTADSGAAPPGATIRAWLPIPRRYDHQREFVVTSSSSPVLSIAPEDSPIRSAYMEQPATPDGPTVFELKYTYVTSGVSFHAMDPALVTRANPSAPDLAPFLREAPHVVFTDTLREISQMVVGAEPNPLRIARRIYMWIAENFLYSYAHEYSTIRNISDFCLRKGYGDCGQHTLLFITLCRLNGIPARWQSGWYTFPGAKTIHDWAEIYLAPYGWVPVDVDMGVFAHRYYTSLSPAERQRLKEFFFGGLDQYRIAANADHSRALDPPKRAFRSDTVDFQRGELESGDANIYFDRSSFSLTAEQTPGP